MNKKFPSTSWMRPESDSFEKPKEKPPENAEPNALWRITSWLNDLGPTTVDVLRQYHTELLRFNLKLNLISRATEREADEVHFADCILGARMVLGALTGETQIYDIGSGNGLPGLILAILAPDIRLSLVESDTRKAEFLKHVSFLLKLENVEILNVRLENLKELGAAAAVSRGFASISKTVLACNRILPVGGRFFHLKGNNWSTEIAELPVQLMSYWKPQLVGEYSLPVSQARRAVVSTQKIR